MEYKTMNWIGINKGGIIEEVEGCLDSYTI